MKTDCKPKKPYHVYLAPLDYEAQAYADAMGPVYDEIIDKMDADEE